MTTLREPFDSIHQKKVETKNGTIVLDYISWSQVADRLDDAAPGWSFTIRQLGDDWCWGQLTIDGRSFDNIGYAENADQTWKKEALKDAVSDALKRCAAMAGVGRYLYDKEAPQTARNGHSAPVRPQVAPPATRSSTALVDEDIDFDSLPVAAAANRAEGSMTFAELADRVEKAGMPKNDIYATADKMFGKGTKVVSLPPGQRFALAVELGVA